MATWVPEELDLEADHVRQVYAKYGAAMYFAQVLEHGLANFVVYARAGRTVRTHEAMEALWNELTSSTMGRQLREVLVEEGLSARLIARLRNALCIRNYLAHDFFRERAEQLMTFRGRNEMLAELEELRAELQSTDDELEPVTRSIMAAKGISQEMLQAELERMRAEIHE